MEQILKAGINEITVNRNVLDGAVVIEDIVNMKTGEILLEANQPFLQTHLEMLMANSIDEFAVCFPENDPTGKVLSESLTKDHTEDPEEAAKEIFKKFVPESRPRRIQAVSCCLECSLIPINMI